MAGASTASASFGKGMLKTTAAVVGFGAVTTAVAVGIRKGSDAIIGFDREMRNVNSIAQLSEGSFRDLERSVLSLAGPTAQSPQTLAKGLYQLVSSGFAADDALKVLKASALAATAGLTTTEVSTKAVAAVLNSYGLNASQAGKVSDALFRTVDRGVISFEELASNIGDVLPFASALGVDVKQVGGAIATMTKAGVSGAETMTRIKGTMAALIKPSEAMRDAYKQLGVASGEDLIRKFGSLQGALQALQKTTGGNKEKLAELFPEIRGLSGALLLTGANAQKANKDLEGLRNSSGATAKALEQQSKSISYWMRLIGATVESSVIRAFVELDAWVKAHSGEIGAVFQALGEAAEFAASVVSTAVAGILQILDGAAKIIRGIVNVIAGVLTADFGRAWEGVKQIFSGALGVVLGGVRVFTAALVATVTAGMGLLRAAFTTAWNAITGATSAAWAAIRSAVSAGASAAVAAIVAITGPARSAATAVWAGVRSAFSSLDGAARAAVDGVAGIVSGIGGKVAAAARSIWNTVKSILSAPINMVVNLKLPKIPDINPFASGTTSAPRGLALVGEKGPELINLNGGEQIFDAMQTRSMMGGGGMAGGTAVATAGGSGGGGNTYQITVSSLDPAASATLVKRALDEFERRNGRQYARA